MAKEKVFITGASSGIGLDLARQFARHGHPLVITAHVESELQAIARDLEAAHGVPVHVVAKDLEQPHAAEELYEATMLEPTPVDILVNNAGLGHLGKFWELPMDAILSMVGGLNKAQVFARRFMTKSAQAKVSKKLYEKAPPQKRKRHRGDVESAAAHKAAA